MRNAVLTVFTSVAATAVHAQPTSDNFWADPINHPLMPLYVVGALMVVVVILILMVARQVFKVLRVLTEQLAREKAAKAGVPYVAPKSILAKWWDKVNASVPVEKERDIELDHEYDGIRELDNHLPPWWKALFYGNIAWSIVYLLVFHVYDLLPLSEEEYQNEVARAEEQRRVFEVTQPAAVVDLDALDFNNDPALIENGKKVFTNNNCGSCHRPDGGGNAIGPNLTDEYWLHGGSAKEIFTTIRDGVLDKGMPAWGRSIKPTDMRDVTYFIMSLQGTNPPDAKAPQGERVQKTGDKAAEERASL